MFNKYDLIIKVCGLMDNAPDYYPTMSSDEFNYYRGYVKALIDVNDLFDELDN